MVKKIDKDVFSSCHARWTKKKSAHEEPSLGRKEGRPWGRGSGGRREKRIYNTLKKKKESEWYPTDLVVLPQYWEEQNHRISKSNNLLNKSFIHHRSKLRHTRAVKLTNG